MCKEEDCDKKVQAKGLCNKHYMQQYRAEKAGTCLKCSRNTYSMDLCESHYKSDLRLRNPSYDTAQRAVLKTTKAELSKEYKAVHRTLHEKRGSASGYQCVDCTNPANEWSLSVESTLYGIPERSAYPFSLKIDDYRPRCFHCHALFDKK